MIPGVMNRDEFTSEIEAVKAEYASDTEKLNTRIERARGTIERAEAQLEKINSKFKSRIAEIAEAYTGISAASGEAEPEPATGAASPRRDRVRKKRGSMDAPVLDLTRRLFEAKSDLRGVTVADVGMVWERLHPDEPIERSTLRGILERQVKKGKLVIVHEGSRGNGDPKLYGIPRPLRQDVIGRSPQGFEPSREMVMKEY